MAVHILDRAIITNNNISKNGHQVLKHGFGFSQSFRGTDHHFSTTNLVDHLLARVRAATDEAVAKIMADRPAIEEGSEASI
ncbi:hypothetical protein LguiB_001744 [Lonicera macranthoides]